MISHLMKSLVGTYGLLSKREQLSTSAFWIPKFGMHVLWALYGPVIL